MNNLLGSLGLGAVEADPNALPNGKYDGDVFKSEFVISKNKGTISHVVTYRVTEGDHKGAQRQVWYEIGKITDANGDVPDSLSEIAHLGPTMSDSQKQWYKKMWIDLGVPEDKVNANEANPEDIVGTPVTFGVKKNGNFINVNFVEVRDGASPGMVEQPQSLSGNPFSF